MANDRRYIDDISKLGFEKATVKHICELYGHQTNIKSTIIELARQQNAIVDSLSGVMMVAEAMKGAHNNLMKKMGEHVPPDAPTPEDDRVN